MKYFLCIPLLLLISCHQADYSQQQALLKRAHERFEDENDASLARIEGFEAEPNTLYAFYKERAKQVKALREVQKMHLLIYAENEVVVREVKAYAKALRSILTHEELANIALAVDDHFVSLEQLMQQDTPLTPYFVMVKATELEGAILIEIEKRVAFVPLC